MALRRVLELFEKSVAIASQQKGGRFKAWLKFLGTDKGKEFMGCVNAQLPGVKPPEVARAAMRMFGDGNAGAHSYACPLTVDNDNNCGISIGETADIVFVTVAQCAADVAIPHVTVQKAPVIVESDSESDSE